MGDLASASKNMQKRGNSQGSNPLKGSNASQISNRSNASRERSTGLRSVERNSNQLRTQFMANLTYKKVWLKPQEKPTSHQTSIIFDWDDTILCTSFLAPH